MIIGESFTYSYSFKLLPARKYCKSWNFYMSYYLVKFDYFIWVSKSINTVGLIVIVQLIGWNILNHECTHFSRS